MTNPDRQHINERIGHLIDEQHERAEGAIVDWLIRTGQWDPDAERKVRRWLAEQARKAEAARAAAAQKPESTPETPDSPKG